MSYEQLYALQLQKGIISPQPNSNPEDQQQQLDLEQDAIPANELSLMIFLINNGGDIFKEYFKELVNARNSDLADEYIEILSMFVYCFVDTTTSAANTG